VASARAGFHLWDVTEVYSSADGAVQFIELTALSGGQQNFGCCSPTIRSTNSLGVNTFTFLTNLPGDTASRTCILGTSNLASFPGGVTPNFIIPPNFIRRPVGGGGAAVIFDALPATAAYTTLPTDGESALLRSGGSMIVVPTNSPRNFQLQSNSIVPVKLLSATRTDPNFVLAFRTATGVNGAAGPNYAVETSAAASPAAWTTVSNVAGNGTLKVVALPIVPGSNQFFRLRVP